MGSHGAKALLRLSSAIKRPTHHTIIMSFKRSPLLPRSLKVLWCLTLLTSLFTRTALGEALPPGSSSNEQCIAQASTYHQVNASVLRAILMVESGLNAWEVRRNSNGTLDVGMAGINSIHFSEIAKFGIAPEQLLDACVATYVAAWHLKKGMQKYGNTWFGIAAYHSVTPYLNNRYQIMIYNQLVKDLAITGQLMKVPPIAP